LRAVLDTSVLIGGTPIPADAQAAISTVSIAELHFGLLIAADAETRAQRATRLRLIEARFPDPLPVDDRVAANGADCRRRSPRAVASRASGSGSAEQA
jgi:predicted nucleic acid-binding protein